MGQWASEGVDSQLGSCFQPQSVIERLYTHASFDRCGFPLTLRQFLKSVLSAQTYQSLAAVTTATGVQTEAPSCLSPGYSSL